MLCLCHNTISLLDHATSRATAAVCCERSPWTVASLPLQAGCKFFRLAVNGQSGAGHLIAIWQLGHCWRTLDGGVGHNKAIYAQAQGHSSNV